jgi:hypothetical protein
MVHFMQELNAWMISLRRKHQEEREKEQERENDTERETFFKVVRP